MVVLYLKKTRFYEQIIVLGNACEQTSGRSPLLQTGDVAARTPHLVLIPHSCFFRPDFFRNRLLSPLNPTALGTRAVGKLTTLRPQRAEDGGGRRAPRPPMDGGAPPQRSHGRDGEEKATMDPSVAPPRSGLDPVARSCGQGQISPAARHRAPPRPELPALRLPPSVAINLGSHR
jgi:hypothetical protein